MAVPLGIIQLIIWDGIEKNHPIEKVIKTIQIFNKKSSDEEVKARIETYCDKLYEKGFVILRDESAPENKE